MIYKLSMHDVSKKFDPELYIVGLKKDEIIKKMQTDRFIVGYSAGGKTIAIKCDEIWTFLLKKVNRLSSQIATALKEEYGEEFYCGIIDEQTEIYLAKKKTEEKDKE